MQLGVDRAWELPYRPAGHAVQAVAPPWLYVPAGHAIWVNLVDPAGQIYPASHGSLQSLWSSPVDPHRPAAHSPEQLLLVWEVVLPKYPAAHSPVQLAVVRPDVLP